MGVSMDSLEEPERKKSPADIRWVNHLADVLISDGQPLGRAMPGKLVERLGSITSMTLGLVGPTSEYLLYYSIMEKGKIVGGQTLATAKCRAGTALWHAYDNASSLEWQPPSGGEPTKMEHADWGHIAKSQGCCNFVTFPLECPEGMLGAVTVASDGAPPISKGVEWLAEFLGLCLGHRKAQKEADRLSAAMRMMIPADAVQYLLEPHTAAAAQTSHGTHQVPRPTFPRPVQQETPVDVAEEDGLFGSESTAAGQATAGAHHPPPDHVPTSTCTPAVRPCPLLTRSDSWLANDLHPACPASALSRSTQGAQAGASSHSRSPAAAVTAAESLCAELLGAKASPYMSRAKEDDQLHPKLREAMARQRMDNVKAGDCSMASGLTPEHVGLQCVHVPGAELAAASSSGSSLETPPAVTQPLPAETGALPTWVRATAVRNDHPPPWADAWRNIRPPTETNVHDLPWSPLQGRAYAAYMASGGREGLRPRRRDIQRWRDAPTVWDVPPSKYTSGIPRTDVTRTGAVAAWLDWHVPLQVPGDNVDPRLRVQTTQNRASGAPQAEPVLGPVTPRDAVKLRAFKTQLPPKMRGGWTLRFVEDRHESMFRTHYNRLHFMTDMAQFFWALVAFILCAHQMYQGAAWQHHNPDHHFWNRVFGVMVSLAPIITTYCGSKRLEDLREVAVMALRLYVVCLTPFKVPYKQLGDVTLFPAMDMPCVPLLLEMSGNLITLGFNHQTRVIRVRLATWFSIVEFTIIFWEQLTAFFIPGALLAGPILQVLALALVIGILGLFHYIGWRREMWRRITWFRRRVKEEAELAKGSIQYRTGGGGQFPRNTVKLKSQEDGTGPLSWHSMPRTMELRRGPAGRQGSHAGPSQRSRAALAEEEAQRAQHAQDEQNARVLAPCPAERSPQDAQHAQVLLTRPEGVAHHADLADELPTPADRLGRDALADDTQGLYLPPDATMTNKMAEAALRQAYQYVQASGFDVTELVGDEWKSCQKQSDVDAAKATAETKLMNKSRPSATAVHTEEVTPAALTPMTIPPRPEARPQPHQPAATPLVPPRPSAYHRLLTLVCNAVSGVRPLAVRVGNWAAGVFCSVSLRLLLYICYAALCSLPSSMQHVIIRGLWWIRNRSKGGLEHPRRKDDPAYTAAMQNAMPFAFFVELFEDQLHVKVHECPSLLEALWPKGSPADIDAPTCSTHNLVVGASTVG